MLGLSMTKKQVYVFHVVSLPHTNTNAQFITCAYTQKVIKFCSMMMSLGHIVYLYGTDAEKNEAECTAFIECGINEFSKENYLFAPFDINATHWINMNIKAIHEIDKCRQCKDFICLIAGFCQKQIADAFPEMMSVEFGIGYEGVFAKYKVFESYSWMHTIYGQRQGANNANGNFFDCVIPNYFNINDFPFSSQKEDYFLFIGRLIDRKGYKIAVDTCKHLGAKLIIAGQGTPPEFGQYVGVVDSKVRGQLMSKAKAVFVPTLYLEPFGGVASEAMLCGTPVITTDWGAFTETVINGKTGFRCHTLQEFIDAANQVQTLDYNYIRQYAISKWSMDVIKHCYQQYFDRLSLLWQKGWYQLKS